MEIFRVVVAVGVEAVAVAEEEPTWPEAEVRGRRNWAWDLEELRLKMYENGNASVAEQTGIHSHSH